MKVTDNAKANSLEISSFKLDYSLPSVFIQDSLGFVTFFLYICWRKLVILCASFAFNLDTMQYFYLNSLSLKELLILHFLPLFLYVWGCLSVCSSIQKSGVQVCDSSFSWWWACITFSAPFLHAQYGEKLTKG